MYMTCGFNDGGDFYGTNQEVEMMRRYAVQHGYYHKVKPGAISIASRSPEFHTSGVFVPGEKTWEDMVNDFQAIGLRWEGVR